MKFTTSAWMKLLCHKECFHQVQTFTGGEVGMITEKIVLSSTFLLHPSFKICYSKFKSSKCYFYIPIPVVRNILSLCKCWWSWTGLVSRRGSRLVGLLYPASIRPIWLFQTPPAGHVKKSFQQNAATRPATQEASLCFVSDLYFWTGMAGWTQWWRSGCEEGGGGEESERLETITSLTHGEDVDIRVWTICLHDITQQLNSFRSSDSLWLPKSSVWYLDLTFCFFCMSLAIRSGRSVKEF